MHVDLPLLECSIAQIDTSNTSLHKSLMMLKFLLNIWPEMHQVLHEKITFSKQNVIFCNLLAAAAVKTFYVRMISSLL